MIHLQSSDNFEAVIYNKYNKEIKRFKNITDGFNEANAYFDALPKEGQHMKLSKNCKVFMTRT